MIRDNWSSFYTPVDVASKITSLIPSRPKPALIGDICAGSGNLLEAARKRWPEAATIAIDADKSAIKSIKNKYASIIGVCCDATDIPRIRAIFSDQIKKCNVIVANPPFGFCEKIEDKYEDFLNETLKQLLEEAHRLKRIEAYMLISNVLFLEKGGVFAALLPENLFSSERWSRYRKIFVSKMFEKIYIGRPKRYFSNSDVKTRIFVGRLNDHDLPVVVKASKRNNEALKKVDVFRGSFITRSPRIYKKLAIPVFHTDSHGALRNNLECSPSKYVYKKNKNYRKRCVLKNNDVVVVRVGKQCGMASVVKTKYIGWHISDCVYIVRGYGSKMAGAVAKKITKQLSSKRRGLTAMYITRADIIRSVQ